MKHLNQIKYAAAALLLCMATGEVNATPTFVTPLLTSTAWFTPGGVDGLNVAALTGNNVGHIYACAFYNSASPAQSALQVSDDNTGNLFFQNLYNTPAGTPDISIGNDVGSANPDLYTVAVAYPVSGGVEVDMYQVFDNILYPPTGGGAPAATYTVTTTATPTAVHIDVVAQTSTPYFSYPQCRYAIVTWDDGAGSVYAAEVDMSATGTHTLSSVAIGNGAAPDVAAVERAQGGNYFIYGLFTYTDATGAYLYYQEYNFTSSSAGTQTQIDNAGSGNISVPRIDAFDDYNINALGGDAVYKIVAQVYNSTYFVDEVRTYDNTMASYWVCTKSTVVDFTTLGGSFTIPGPYNCYAPTVAVGGAPYSGFYPSDASQFLISSFAHYNTAEDVLVMEPMDYTNSTGLYSGNEYFWVSQDYLNWNDAGVYNYASAVASPPNDPQDCSILAWAYNNGSGVTVYNKITPSAFAFRQQASVPAVTAETWQAYPNPANTALNLNHADGTEYSVTDMAGNAILHGLITDGSAQIGVGLLAPGSYAIVVYKNGGMSGEKMFVKE